MITTTDSFLRLRVEDFYVGRLKSLDSGDATGWSATFVEDGIFATNARANPSRGRSAICEEVRTAHAALVARGAHRRHWLGMLSATEEPDGTVRASFYALVYEIETGGEARLMASTTGESVLEQYGADGFMVRGEWIRRDDLAPIS